MPELRSILLLIGLVLLAGVYLWGRRRTTARRDDAPSVSRVEPRLDAGLPWETKTLPEAEPEPMIAEPMIAGPTSRRQLDTQLELDDRVAGAEAGTGDPAAQKILALHVRSSGGADFAGPDLLRVFEEEGLTFGEYGAFHHLDPDGRSLFTVVSMLEPGSFPIEEMDEFSTRGVTSFLMVRPTGSVEALARMIACARRLADQLGGEVLDEAGSTLTNQRATHMKEEIVEFLRITRLIESAGTGL